MRADTSCETRAKLKNRVLYFPYIRVPASTWLTQMLLYWDQVSSIVPYEFIHRPGSLGPYMRSLVEHELVFQVIPGEYIHTIPKFEGAFQVYLDALGPEGARRRTKFASGDTFKIHIEKMGHIGEALVYQNLARDAGYPWYEVESDTAHDFMSYLAAALGQLASVDSSPVTDEEGYLDRFVRAGVAEDRVAHQLQSLRVQVLKTVLPVPKHPIEPTAIRAFKDRHGGLFGDFRRRVERELVLAAGVADRSLQQRQLEIFFDEAAAGVEQVQAAMREARWETIQASLSVLAAIPGVSQIFGLAAALWDALSRGRQRVPSQEFAFAAYARLEFKDR